MEKTEKYNIYQDIVSRTNGDIYIGVVGPCRTGKSTFITKFMEKLVIPNISNKLQKQIALDELPQSAEGKTIMTSEPKFIPANAVKIQIKNKVNANVRLIDCVGYLVDGVLGHEENGKARLVKTPWSDDEIPFSKAAEIGTKKVITEYSTIGILVTADGSFTNISRDSYELAEERVVEELKDCNKPFIIVLKCKNPNEKETIELRNSLEEKYQVPVVGVNVNEMDMEDINGVLEKILFEFPMQNFDVDIPSFLKVLPENSSIITEILSRVKESSKKMQKMRDFNEFLSAFSEDEKFFSPDLLNVDLSSGETAYEIRAKQNLFFAVLSEECGEKIDNDKELMAYVKSLAEAKESYEKLKTALYEVDEKGYGVVMPSVKDMVLQEPELVKQGGKYSVRLKASAPSLHIMKVDVNAEVTPMIGTEKQSEDLKNYLLTSFEEDQKGIWETNMFGKSLSDLMSESLQGKVDNVKDVVQGKLRKTLTKIVNEGKGGIICILL
ncbi:MAG: stage IV sporulation protein A [Clostridia bacterium]|nr:stage IV sporulation protein A [Clostridia bacterium]